MKLLNDGCLLKRHPSLLAGCETGLSLFNFILYDLYVFLMRSEHGGSQ